MWQLIAGLAVICDAAEHVIDKAVIVKDKTIDALSASFIRTFSFFAFSCLAAMLGVFGELSFKVTWPIIGLAALWMVSALCYSHLLKKVELSGMDAIAYVTPSLFLLVDTLFLNVQLLHAQEIGIILLTVGGFLFSVETHKRGLRSLFSTRIWAIFLFRAFVSGCDYYLFKYYSATSGLSEVSFIFNVWLWVNIGYILAAFFRRGSWRLMRDAASKNQYLMKSILSKGIDFLSSILWLHAASMAAVSQVQALGSLYPIVLLLFLYLGQRIFRVEMEENFRRKDLWRKAIAVLILCVGGWLVS